MSRWKKSYVMHIGLWALLSVISLFLNFWMPVVFGFVLSVATLFWTPLGFLSGIEDPHSAMYDASGIPDNLIIIWFSFLALIAVFLVFIAIKKWRSGSKTLLKLLFHIVIFVIGVFLLAIAGSINFPLVL